MRKRRAAPKRARKKKAKKRAKPIEYKPLSTRPAFLVARWHKQDSPGNGYRRYHVRLLAKNGVTVLASPPLGYASKAGLLRALHAVARTLGVERFSMDLIEQVPEPR